MNPEAILVVDDDRDVASTVSDYLTREGHAVTVVYSGAEGLARLRAGSIALLLVDLRLPDMDGTDVMRAAQRLDFPPEIVIMTGYATVTCDVQGRCSVSRRTDVGLPGGLPGRLTSAGRGPERSPGDR